MAFNLYFAGSISQDIEKLIQDEQCCKLYSYANDKKEIEKFLKMSPRGKLLVDSGAFSVAHSGKVVDIDEYIDFINSHPEVENFIELDEIPFPVLNFHTAEASAQGSWRNYLYMVERVNDWKKILPVYHFGEDIKYFKQILEFTKDGEHIPYICIGGRHGVSTNDQEKYFNNLFNVIQHSSNPNVKVHVLGMTILSVLERYPFYSADSTTYRMHAAYALIFTPYGPVSVSTRDIGGNHILHMQKDKQEVINSYIKKYGFTLEQLQEDHQARTLYNAKYWVDWCKNYQYKPKSVVTKQQLF